MIYYMVFALFFANFICGCRSWNYNEIPEIKNNEKMVIYCTEMIEHNPRDPRYYFFRGLAYSYMEKPEKAVENYEIVVKLDPSFVAAYLNLGLDYHKLRDYHKALLYFKRALYLFSATQEDKRMAYLYRAAVYSDMKEYTSALTAINHALELSPDNIDTLYAKAMILNLMNDYPGSAKILERLVALDPGDYEVLRSYCRLLMSCPDQEIANPNLALEYANECYQERPCSFESSLLLAQAYYAIGDYVEAEKYIKEAFSRKELDNGSKLQQELIETSKRINEKR